jgi:hypothetical protein
MIAASLDLMGRDSVCEADDDVEALNIIKSDAGSDRIQAC